MLLRENTIYEGVFNTRFANDYDLFEGFLKRKQAEEEETRKKVEDTVKAFMTAFLKEFTPVIQQLQSDVAALAHRH